VQKNETVNVYITDMSGKRVLSKQMTAKPGVNQLPLTNLNGLPKGIYVVQVVTTSKSFNAKMTVQ
jgi:hypothetical protein